MKFNPHEYQSKAIRFCLERACAGLFLSPGLGKTSIMLDVFEVLRAKGLIKQMLVLAPLRVCYSVWPAEVTKWDDFGHLKVGVLHGPDKLITLNDKSYDVLVMNYEGLRWLAGIRAKLPEMLVIDESSKLKHINTQRFKTLKTMLDKFKRRYILTGSPASNSLLDLFGQLYAMDQGATFGPYITKYRSDYFNQGGFGGYEWRLKPGADIAIHEKLAPRVMSLAAEDYLTLPPLVETTIEVTLPPPAMLQYLQMEKQLKLDLDSGKVTAANAAVATMICRQIANGGVYTGIVKHEAIDIHEVKIEATLDLVEELAGQPTIVVFDFKHDLARLKKALGKDTPHISGGVSPKQSQEIVDAWNAGEIPVLLGHPASMSHGLNLQRTGRAIIFHSLTWSWEDRMQLIRRIYRQGQEYPVFVYDIVAKGTIDEAIQKAVKGKQKGENALLGALRDYWVGK